MDRAAPPARTRAVQLDGLSALGLGDDWLRGVLWGNGLALFGLSG